MRGLSTYEVDKRAREAIEEFARELGLDYSKITGSVFGSVKSRYLPKDLVYSTDEQERELGDQVKKIPRLWDSMNALLDHLGLEYVGKKPTIKFKEKK